MLIYPALIVILIMSLFSKFERVKLATQVGVIVAILFSIGDFLPGRGFGNNFFTKMNSLLPLDKQGIAWLLPPIITVILCLIIFIQMNPKPLTEGI